MERWNENGFPRMATVIPDNTRVGQAIVNHSTPNAEAVAMARLMAVCSSSGSGRGTIRAGETYARLFVGGTLWMSDVPDERRDHYSALHKARGEVLIGGLGLGMVALACAAKPEVSRVTVIENNADVIHLVTPYLHGALRADGIDPDKLDVIEADLFKWKPAKGQTFDTLWFDVWSEIDTSNLKEITTMNRRSWRWMAPGAWRGSWCEELLRRRARRERRRRPHGWFNPLSALGGKA